MTFDNRYTEASLTGETAGRSRLHFKRYPPLLIRFSLGALTMAALAACSHAPLPIISNLHLPALYLPHAMRMVDTVDQPSNLIERSLSECDKRVEAGEAACLKRSLSEAKLTVSSLIAMLPGCSAGQVCHYQYATDDKVGLLPSATTHFKVRWQADFDFTKAVDRIENVPLSVKQV